MKAKRAFATIAACGLVGALAIGGTLAYLTDNETHTNKVTISGDIQVDLVEENWDETDENDNGVPDPAEELVPNEEVAKDPKVVNTGDNPAYAFIRLTVPVKDVTRVLDNGTLVQKDKSTDPISTSADGDVFHEPQDIFFFKLLSTNPAYSEALDKISAHENHWGQNWVRISDEDVNVEKNAAGTYQDQTVGQAVYVFGYNTMLNPEDETNTLFDKIQIKNIIEGELSKDEVQNIKVEAFAIQADNIIKADGTVVPTDRALTEAELKEVYNIFVEQNGTVADDGTFTFDKNQGDGHGQSEKEAETNNDRKLDNTARNASPAPEPTPEP